MKSDTMMVTINSYKVTIYHADDVQISSITWMVMTTN